MPQNAAIILAAGKGTRMKSDRPKVLHRIGQMPMINHVLANLAPLNCRPSVVVVAPGMDDVAKAVAPMSVVVQDAQLGTGHAVRCARAGIGDVADSVLILFGDSPFVSTAIIQRLLDRRAGSGNPAIVVLGMRPADPSGYGRLILDKEGMLAGIVEHKDADQAERAIPLCNSGVMAVDGSLLWPLVDALDNKNAKGEFYLTDIVALAGKQGRVCTHVEAPAEELIGINSRKELAEAEAHFQARRRAQAMEEGVTLTDPASVFFAADTRLGQDVVIGPNVVFGPGVDVQDHAEIRAFCHIEGARIERGAIIGPFARLRPGSIVGESARVGNFVEVKNSRLGSGAKANHLTYLGDTDVGAGANIGAGTITCNYDGFAKARTVIGENAFIGSNSALVAPVTIGSGAIVAAGSVITQDVPTDAMAVARAGQVTKADRAKIFRSMRGKLKTAKD